MNLFESQVVRAFNGFFIETETLGVAYRTGKASVYTAQYCDVLVDGHFYLAIECKSFEAKQGALYFSKFSTRKDGTHQLDTLNEFILRSQRKGYLAVEITKPRRYNAYLLPFDYVFRAWTRNEQKGLTVLDIKANGFAFDRVANGYRLDTMLNDPLCPLCTLTDYERKAAMMGFTVV